LELWDEKKIKEYIDNNKAVYIMQLDDFAVGQVE
jgi:hypothetical protein